MNLRSINVPLWIRFTNSLGELKEELSQVCQHRRWRTTALVLDDIMFTEPALVGLRAELEQDLPHCHTFRCLEADLEYAHQLQRQLIVKDCESVIAIGGGKTIDMGKYVAAKNEIPFVSVPSQISHDGIASPVAVLKVGESVYSLGAHMPIAVLIDVPTVMSAPVNRLRAGIGDLVSNITAMEDWKLAAGEGKEEFDDFAALLATFAAQSVLAYRRPQLEDKNFMTEVFKALTINGISMEIARRSRPCSGAEHLISHALDKLFVARARLHGEQVGWATIFTAFLHQINWQEIRDFLQHLGLPISLRELGFTPQEMVQAIQFAPQTRPKRFTILNTTTLGEKDIITIFEKTGALA